MLNNNEIIIFFILVSLITGLVVFIAWIMLKLVIWGNSMSKGAYLFLAFFPLISLMPIPPLLMKMFKRPSKSSVNAKKTQETTLRMKMSKPV